MTDDELVALFLRAQDVLHADDNRLQRSPLQWRDFETVTKLCFRVQAIGEAGDTPQRLALGRLACTTAALITTAVVDAPDNPVIVAEWRQARREHAALVTRGNSRPPPRRTCGRGRRRTHGSPILQIATIPNPLCAKQPERGWHAPTLNPEKELIPMSMIHTMGVAGAEKRLGEIAVKIARTPHQKGLSAAQKNAQLDALIAEHDQIESGLKNYKRGPAIPRCQ